MALQGIFYGSTANVRITPMIQWSATQSVAGNYSDITATLSYTKKNSNPTTGGWWSGSLTIGEGTKKVSSQYIEVYQDKVTEVMTHTVRVYHDSYGKASVTISATGGITNPSSSTLQNTKISRAVTLDTIPRASGIACNGVMVGQTPTITITRADKNFLCDITYVFGELSGTIAEKTGETTIKSWRVPEEFYSQMLDKKIATGTLTCHTYNGSTKIGTTTCLLVVGADENLCKPELSYGVEDSNPKTIALTGDKNVLVRYESTASCTCSVQGKNGATVTKITVNGTNAESFPNVETGTFLFRAEDSRGFVTEGKAEKTLISYIPLTGRATAGRTDPTSGNATLTVEGICFSGSFGKEENTVTVSYRRQGEETYSQAQVEAGENAYAARATLMGLDYTQNFTYEVVVEDKLRSVALTVTIGKSVPVFHWGENDFTFEVPVNLPEGPLADYVIETGAEDIWRYEKWASGKAVCWGNRNFGDVEISSAWGSLFLSPRLEQSLPRGLFVETPTVNMRMVGSNNGGAFLMTDTVTGHGPESTGRFRLCRPTEFTALQVVMGFHCLGRWK